MIHLFYLSSLQFAEKIWREENYNNSLVHISCPKEIDGICRKKSWVVEGGNTTIYLQVNLIMEFQPIDHLNFISTVKLGDKELFGHPEIVPWRQMFLILGSAYPYEVNWQLVMGNGSLKHQFVPYQTVPYHQVWM